MQYKRLLEPITIGKYTYKHRMVASPIYCGTFSCDPMLKMVLFDGMTTRARGGAAQVTVGETPVDFVHANREPFEPVDYTKHEGKMFDTLSQIATEIKKENAVALIEISHCGFSRMNIPDGGTPIGPSEGINEYGLPIVPMDRALMDEVINYHVECAKYMIAAGFNGIMIHSGHGWLLHQFLSKRSNHRTDEYGGSLENRAKFPIEVIKAVRDAVGKDCLIEVRVSGDEMEPDGMQVEETAAFCHMIEEYVDIIHVSVGTYRNPVLSGEFSSMYAPHALNAQAAKTIKQAVNIPVAVVGGINTPEIAEKLLEDGVCDLVAFGRVLTADPDFPKKVIEGRAEDITKCIRCFKCFPGPLEDQIAAGKTISLPGCSVNPKPFNFNFKMLGSIPKGSENVLIVGGGIAGIEAAIIASERGHKVTLLEKTDQLGGLLHFTDTDNYKTDLRDFMECMIQRLKDHPVDVVYNHEFTKEDLIAYAPEVVVVAVGSEPLILPIPGIENAIHAVDVYKHMDDLGENLVMVGGGLVGCEVGLHLAKAGKKVTIVEMGDEVAPDSYPMHRIGMIDEMEKQNITCLTNRKCVEIEQTQVKVTNEDGETEIVQADNVVIALGMKAHSDLKNAIETVVKEQGIKVVSIGDCVRPAKIYECMREGFAAAMNVAT